MRSCDNTEIWLWLEKQSRARGLQKHDIYINIQTHEPAYTHVWKFKIEVPRTTLAECFILEAMCSSTCFVCAFLSPPPRFLINMSTDKSSQTRVRVHAAQTNLQTRIPVFVPLQLRPIRASVWEGLVGMHCSAQCCTSLIISSHLYARAVWERNGSYRESIKKMIEMMRA